MGEGPRPNVAVIGGGCGGSSAARALDEFADVTLVEPRDLARCCSPASGGYLDLHNFRDRH